MRYKVGDKVRIKTWDSMVNDYGMSGYFESGINKERIPCDKSFYDIMEKQLEEIDTNRVVTIKEIEYKSSYRIKELNWEWSDDMIECLVEDYVKSEPIESRFEILDIRE